MAAKKVDALEERLEGEMNQIKTTVEERISSMQGPAVDLRDMMKKLLEIYNQTAASVAKVVEGKNTNSKIRREDDEVEIVDGERIKSYLEPFQREDRGVPCGGCFVPLVAGSGFLWWLFCSSWLLVLIPSAAPSVPPLAACPVAALPSFCVAFSDPEVDHGFIYNDQGRVDIIKSHFFDFTPGVDQTVEEYVNRIIFQLAATFEEQISSVQWMIITKVKKAPNGKSLPSLQSSSSGDENFQVGENLM
ncbi:hypothetical protein M5K25_015215 [Dendrobium thyrsiflorum]|uniref:Uncharacterized protein n=1 Tax=Dendrobium thyrsiflorum TaxID=117978 RepID=A0ABD0UWY4_DENTH